MKPLIFHPEATAELDMAIGWYNERRAGLGLEFHDALQVVLDRIARNPLSGSPAMAHPFRFSVTESFPYVVYWMELPDAVWIAAIAHAKRRPDYWRHRMP